MLLVPQATQYYRVIASPEVIDGVFARMFFLHGHGLECFELLTRETGFTGTDIFVWKADYTCSQDNTITEIREEVIDRERIEVTLNYIGYLENRTVFDSSIANWQNMNVTPESSFEGELNPITFKQGIGEVIPGFESRVLELAEGEESTITIPLEEGYTQEGHPLFNKTLYFKVRIEEKK